MTHFVGPRCARLRVVPCSIRDASAFVRLHHRHHRPPRGGLFAVAVAVEAVETVCGVAIVGRPVSRMLQDGWTVEVIRLATDGTPSACTALYGAAWRAARAMGYRRAVTYTLPAEGGGLAARGRVALRRRGRWRQLEPRGQATRRRAPDAGEAEMGGCVA